jgi:hypothetical protein
MDAPVTRRKKIREPEGRKKKARLPIGVHAVSAAELRALKRGLKRQGRKRTRSRRAVAPMRWNPEPEDVQRSVAQLVLTLVEFLRKLMERQAIRRMEQRTLTKAEVESVGLALMRLEETIQAIANRFDLSSEDLNLDLGPIKLI